jgi:hypothetical protein
VSRTPLFQSERLVRTRDPAQELHLLGHAAGTDGHQRSPCISMSLGCPSQFGELMLRAARNARLRGRGSVHIVEIVEKQQPMIGDRMENKICWR